jgi:tetratricopeptide (TPR) repeat protein
MRRWIWLLGLFAIAVLGAVWWTSRNAIRTEPLDAQRFAQMRETEQVEWLIEQILARSKRTDTLAKIMENIPFIQSSHFTRPLLQKDIDIIGTACVEYDLPHWLGRCERYIESESDRERLRVYQAILQARRGNWRTAEQVVQRIPTPSARALALAHLGHLQMEAGQSNAARRTFEQAYSLLSQPIDMNRAFEVFDALNLLVRFSHFSKDPKGVARILQGFPANFHDVSMRCIAEVYRQRGDTERLNQLIAAAPPASRRIVRAKLVHALIEQGRVDEGLKMLVQMGYCPAELIVPIIHSLHQQGRKNEAQRLAGGLYKALEYDFSKSTPSMTLSSSAWLETSYGWVVVPADIEAQRLLLMQLASLYIEWGQEARAEQLVEASPYLKGVEHALIIHYNLALAYHEVGKRAQAYKHLEQALAKVRKSLDLQRERAAALAGPANIYATPADYARALKISETMLSSARSWNWTVLLSAPIEAYAMLEDYARAFEVAETMLSPDEQREVLVALLRERAYGRNPLWRQLSETGL